MPTPILTPGAPDAQALQMWLEQTDQRLALLEGPQGPTLVFACTQALLPAPASFINCVLRVTDLNILAASDGTNWRRQDTGAAI